MSLKRNAIIFLTLLIAVVPRSANAYMSSSVKDHFFSDALLRELVDRMGKDLADAADSYIDPLPVNDQLALMARASKDLEAEQMDYDALLEGNPSPSLRDQEYLQHSTLWGHQYMSGGAGEGPHRVKPQVKTDATLPAYCNPPNPCPVGYTEEQGCQVDFENTAAFSREYQAAQECMCDGEHMFDCPGQDQGEQNRQMDSDIESFLAQQFHTQEHKNLVAKKFHSKKSYNPYLEGEKLPIAAKKGNVMVY
ncbi:neuroendocrine protein 7B2 isoform X2 [Lutzomyia longipalpis]|uniref:neuroendocrine protein 7B2 isoform X2 n=1 Tax=Lutzomyia longipalpis TaxID=7200 RepID=UPI0024842328|nr:neuroendocrine protein 7B2 isoform X2 [Lutzomyia longipalpis]